MVDYKKDLKLPIGIQILVHCDKLRMKGIKARLESYYRVIYSNNESLDKAQTDRNQTITWTIRSRALLFYTLKSRISL